DWRSSFSSSCTPRRIWSTKSSTFWRRALAASLPSPDLCMASPRLPCPGASSPTLAKSSAPTPLRGARAAAGPRRARGLQAGDSAGGHESVPAGPPAARGRPLSSKRHAKLDGEIARAHLDRKLLDGIDQPPLVTQADLKTHLPHRKGQAAAEQGAWLGGLEVVGNIRPVRLVAIEVAVDGLDFRAEDQRQRDPTFQVDLGSRAHGKVETEQAGELEV